MLISPEHSVVLLVCEQGPVTAECDETTESDWVTTVLRLSAY